MARLILRNSLKPLAEIQKNSKTLSLRSWKSPESRRDKGANWMSWSLSLGRARRDIWRERKSKSRARVLSEPAKVGEDRRARSLSGRCFSQRARARGKWKIIPIERLIIIIIIIRRSFQCLFGGGYLFIENVNGPNELSCIPPPPVGRPCLPCSFSFSSSLLLSLFLSSARTS